MRHPAFRAIGAALFLLASQATAWAWEPERAVRVVVPFAAGGPSDTIARIITQGMAEALGQPVFVDNVPGAGGATGIQRFLDEAYDGHTLLVGHMGTHGAAPGLKSQLGYDPVKDFAAVGLAASTPMVITVAPKLAVKDLAELSVMLRVRGTQMHIAHAGQGSVSHAAAVLLQSTVGSSAALSSYSGTGPALNDLLADKVDILIDQIVNVAPAISSKRVQALAVVGSRRSEILPTVAATGELGFNVEMNAWNAFFVKAGTPDNQIAVLHGALRYALNDPRTRARLLDLGAELPDDERGTPEALAALVEEEVNRWSVSNFEIRK
jgi:tripartite-type tricarboxylate transporter receptor subunit TctC